jgi:hypothetical protein
MAAAALSETPQQFGQWLVGTGLVTTSDSTSGITPGGSICEIRSHSACHNIIHPYEFLIICYLHDANEMNTYRLFVSVCPHVHEILYRRIIQKKLLNTLNLYLDRTCLTMILHEDLSAYLMKYSLKREQFLNKSYREKWNACFM